MSAGRTRRYLTREGRIERALDRARGAKHHAWKTGKYTYKVKSATAPGVWYDLEVTPTGIRCSCAAGLYRRVCWHSALVALRLEREANRPRVRVLGVAPTPRTPESPDEIEDWILGIPVLASLEAT